MHAIHPDQQTLDMVGDIAAVHANAGHPPAPQRHSGHRHNDQSTSIKAARRAADPAALTARQVRVLRNLAAAGMGGLSDHHHPGLPNTSAGKRRLELQEAGLVTYHLTATGEQVKTHNAYGSEVLMFELTEAGWQCYRNLGPASSDT